MPWCIVYLQSFESPRVSVENVKVLQLENEFLVPNVHGSFFRVNYILSRHKMWIQILFNHHSFTVQFQIFLRKWYVVYPHNAVHQFNSIICNLLSLHHFIDVLVRVVLTSFEPRRNAPDELVNHVHVHPHKLLMLIRGIVTSDDHPELGWRQFHLNVAERLPIFGWR